MQNANHPESFPRGAAALIPPPRQLSACGGHWRLPAAVSIAVRDPALADLAALLAGHLRAAGLGGLDPAVVADPAQAGIVLALDPALAEEAHVLAVVEGGATLTGGSAAGVAWAAASLVQALVVEHAERRLPLMRVADAPQFGYRGLMVDVARHPHSLVTLKKVVVLCWFYKVRFLQLHLADVEAFAFPSTAFPDLATPGRHLPLEDWRELEAFAARHQVVIVPELDVPGHANQALRRLCPTDPPTGAPVVNPVSERTFAVLATLLDEILAVFPRTPFVHIGADEVAYDGWARCRDCAAFLRERGLTSIEEAYRHFIARMHGLVTARGRRMIVWEGFAAEGVIPIPFDVIVQFFDVEYLQPEQAIARGHQVINSSWGPLYVVPGNATCPLPLVHQWYPGIFGGNALSCVPDALAQAPAFAACDRLDPFFARPLAGRRHPFAKALPAADPALLGAMMCSWEMLEGDQVPALRRHLAAMSERCWNPQAGRPFTDFLLRLESTDWRLAGLLRAVVLADRNRIPDFGPCGPEYGPFINDLEAGIRDDGPVARIAAPPAGLALPRRAFAGDFCDLHRELQERAAGTAWFVHRFTAVHAAEPTVPTALLGYDGPVRVWLNGVEVFTDRSGANPALRDMAAIPLAPRSGANELAIALDADGGKAWGIYLRLRSDMRASGTRGQIASSPGSPSVKAQQPA
ncbi:MAG: family 20 glycosylhydrolase [Planctomycetes bacterium]|nr:family 20 glycosylhydrolase [Planctomycetota bacterium]